MGPRDVRRRSSSGGQRGSLVELTPPPGERGNLRILEVLGTQAPTLAGLGRRWRGWRRWSRIFFMTDGSVMKATIRISAPHWGQSTGATS